MAPPALKFLSASIAVTTLLVVACSGGSSHRGSPTVAGLAPTARAAAAALTSSVVQVTGTASQRDQSVDFQIRYTGVAPDRIAYDDESTLAGKMSRIALVIIPPNAWSLENGAWTPFTAIDTRTFSADHVWSLVPFDVATLVGTEEVGATSARHYHASVDVQLPFGELAGTLIASEDASFDGTLDHVDVDYWLDDVHGWPVKAVYSATGGGKLDVTAELTQANDPGIVVAPP